MSRYRVEEPSAASNTLDIYGPDGRVIGQIYGADDTESLRFKLFIEDYDEIVKVLRNAAKIAFDITAGDFDHAAGLSWRSFGDVFNLLNQVDVLLECIDGKEAE
jgi:hypothetical protein